MNPAARPRVRLARALLPALCLLSSCGSNVDLRAAPTALAKCEAPTAEVLVPTPPMLPGRRCGACHTDGAQASMWPWTASGTVFDASDSPCNTGGLDNVKVELIDGHGPVLITLYTNRTGNFFTSENLDLSLFRARVSKDGKMKEMQSLQSIGDCAICHFPGGPAGGRIYLR